jgi:acetolactate synthase-1/2/3 large subunit
MNRFKEVTKMRADDWIVDYLIRGGTTDVFGIPGVVVMDFLYAVDRRKPDITPHLCYHEQGAAFAACGYAQSTGKLGVAYATRGPGFTNMITAIADAYYDSIPTMFITSHSSTLEPEMRVMNNQEIDTVSLVESITKKAIRIDDIDNLQKEVALAYYEATHGRKGPVFLDIYNGLFSKEVNIRNDFIEEECDYKNIINELIENLEKKIKVSKRPIILIGNGTRNEKNKQILKEIACKFKIPILSSRVGQDIVPEAPEYFGFVGSRATRYSNFILSKADLILSIGNRLAFPVKSKSFCPIVENAYIIRIDIDNAEFKRDIPNGDSYAIDADVVIPELLNARLKYSSDVEWLSLCNFLRNKLDGWDTNNIVSSVMNIIGATDAGNTLVCDVGNHSFWVTTAYAYKKAENRILYSGSFGTLGSALPKAIGAYYATRKPVVCFTGDQGVQFNIQELQFISLNQIPVTIIILNNCSSGMIMEREIDKYGEYLIHTTIDSGYSYPDFEKVADCYGIDYIRFNLVTETLKGVTLISNKPAIIELIIDKDTELRPSLPIGKNCQDLHPEIPRDLYDELDSL